MLTVWNLDKKFQVCYVVIKLQYKIFTPQQSYNVHTVYRYLFVSWNSKICRMVLSDTIFLWCQKLVIFITSRGIGGGHKRLYRLVDFKRNKFGIEAKVITIEYDPNRNAYICLLNYKDGEKRYILHPRNLLTGDTVLSDFTAPIKIGNALPLFQIPLGTNIHNVEFRVFIKVILLRMLRFTFLFFLWFI